jgi:hypothetical protein
MAITGFHKVCITFSVCAGRFWHKTTTIHSFFLFFWRCVVPGKYQMPEQKTGTRNGAGGREGREKLTSALPRMDISGWASSDESDHQSTSSFVPGTAGPCTQRRYPRLAAGSSCPDHPQRRTDPRKMRNVERHSRTWRVGMQQHGEDAHSAYRDRCGPE